jgi:5-formyltetrahydrofolate cyclo-ligase
MIADIPPDQVASRSHRASRLLFEQPEYLNAEVVMVFLSLPSEMDTAPIVLRSWQDGKRVLAPKMDWNQRRLWPVEIHSLTDDLTVSSLGIREPASDLPLPISLIDLVMVPGLGFDEFGHRLGRGRGFYDRFLSHPDCRATACALAFEEQVTSTIPTGPLDRPVDMLVTDASVRRFHRAH